MAVPFPRHTFPLAEDPAFDALDIGVAGRLLVRGGAFALQNAEGLGLDLAAAGPLTRVQVGASSAAGAANATELKQGLLYARQRAAAQKRRRANAPHESDEDGQFGDDEKDAAEAGVHAHLHEGCRGNLACALQDNAGRVFVVHAGGDDLHDLDVSHLRPRRRGRTWQLTRMARVAGSAAAPLAACDMECDTEEGEGESAGSVRPSAHWQPSRLVQITAEAHGDVGELAWVAARSRDCATFYRLRHCAHAGVQDAHGGEVKCSCINIFIFEYVYIYVGRYKYVCVWKYIHIHSYENICIDM